ncbi:hypothetical protein J4471_06095 [Candidatus Woesearchaeota archaeon]|nr:hypothetical protein [Candidatus Woesearchaeota archaeon]
MKKILLLILPISLILFIAGCQQPQTSLPPQCSDECSEDSCEGFNYISCLTKEDGCKDSSNEGIIKSKCGVDCLSTFDCASNQICSKSYKCETKVKPKPVDVQTKGICGNGQIEAGENCGNCIDAKCLTTIDPKETCINDVCTKYEKPYFEYIESMKKYCGYTARDFDSENIAFKSIKAVESCTLQINDQVTASGKQLTDAGFTEVSKQWSCSTQSIIPIKMPQYAAIELDNIYVINRLRLMQNGFGKDDKRNVNEISIAVSVDSTNGVDGYWTEVAKKSLNNKYQSKEEIMVIPISAKWIKVNVNSLYHPDSNIFSLAELEVYKARYLCTSDINEG